MATSQWLAGFNFQRIDNLIVNEDVAKNVYCRWEVIVYA
nr:MAG TPA: hypothetical protein [Caudoviricetes sp.]